MDAIQLRHRRFQKMESFLTLGHFIVEDVVEIRKLWFAGMIYWRYMSDFVGHSEDPSSNLWWGFRRYGIANTSMPNKNVQSIAMSKSIYFKLSCITSRSSSSMSKEDAYWKEARGDSLNCWYHGNWVQRLTPDRWWRHFVLLILHMLQLWHTPSTEPTTVPTMKETYWGMRNA